MPDGPVVGYWPPAHRFLEAMRTLFQEYDVSLTFRNGVWMFRSTDLFILVTIEGLASYLERYTERPNP